MKERQISQTEKDNAVLNYVNYQAQEAILDPNLPDAFKDEILGLAIDTIQKVAERKVAYNAKYGEGRRTRRPSGKCLFIILDDVASDTFQGVTNERRIIYSGDPKSNRAAAPLIVSREFQHEKRQIDSTVEEIDNRLSNYAHWLKQHAVSILTGDFSQWLSIYEYKVSSNREQATSAFDWLEMLRMGNQSISRSTDSSRFLIT